MTYDDLTAGRPGQEAGQGYFWLPKSRATIHFNKEGMKVSRLALPEPEARQAAHRQELMAMRFEIAKEVMANLMPVDYGMAMHNAAESDDPFGTKSDDEKPSALHLQLDVGCAARISVAAADALLTVLGHIKPPASPAITPGPR